MISNDERLKSQSVDTREAKNHAHEALITSDVDSEGVVSKALVALEVKFTEDDLLTPAGEVLELATQTTEQTRGYHLLPAESVPFVAVIGFYGKIDRAMLSPKINLHTCGSGNILLSFLIPDELLTEAKDGTGLSLSQSTHCDDFDPRFKNALNTSPELLSNSGIGNLQAAQASDKLGRISSGYIDWTESLRATIIHNLCTESKLWPPSLGIIDSARPSLEDIEAFQDRFRQLFDALVIESQNI